jgi:hypothetical protein
MHGHVIRTDGLAFTVDADKQVPVPETVVIADPCTVNCQ